MKNPGFNRFGPVFVLVVLAFLPGPAASVLWACSVPMFRYALDGTMTSNSVMMGRGIQCSTSTAAWHGGTLVIKTEQPFHNPETGREENFEVIRRLSLESPGQLLVETTFGGVLGGPPTETTSRYTRDSEPP